MNLEMTFDMALLVCAVVSLGEHHLTGQMKPTHNEKGQILMCSASDYKSPVTSWQFCCFGGTFSCLWVKLSRTPDILSPSCLPALCLLPPPPPWNYQERPGAFVCVNFPLAAPELSESFYFPQRGSPDARVCDQWAMCYSALPGLARVSLQKCKHRCCNSAPEWWAGLQTK